VQYYLDHAHGRFYLATDADGAHNFKLLTSDSPIVADQHFSNWTELIPHCAATKIEDVDIFSVLGTRPHAPARQRASVVLMSSVSRCHLTTAPSRVLYESQRLTRDPRLSTRSASQAVNLNPNPNLTVVVLCTATKLDRMCAHQTGIHEPLPTHHWRLLS